MFDYFLVEVLLELLDLGRRLFEYLIDFFLSLFPSFHLTLDSKLFHVDGLGFFLKYVRLLLKFQASFLHQLLFKLALEGGLYVS